MNMTHLCNLGNRKKVFGNFLKITSQGQHIAIRTSIQSQNMINTNIHIKNFREKYEKLSLMFFNKFSMVLDICKKFRN